MWNYTSAGTGSFITVQDIYFWQSIHLADIKFCFKCYLLMKVGRIMFSNVKISSHFSCVTSFFSFTAIS